MIKNKKNIDEASSILDIFLNQGRDLSPMIKTALSKLYEHHVSGISPEQRETPMMKQYIAAKEEVKDALIFFRMGDFYELFGADAVIVADICNLTLTSRDKNSDDPVPMAGVPVIAWRNAVKKCINIGFKVAIVDQVEDPKYAKGIVRREIVRIATPAVPGDLGDDDIENTGTCYLATVINKAKMWTFAYIDVSTGEFRICANLTEDNIYEEILRIKPKEIITTSDNIVVMRNKLRGILSSIPSVISTENWVLRSDSACIEIFNDFFGKKKFGEFGLNQVNLSLQVIAATLNYLKSTQKSILANIKYIEVYELSSHLLIDENTRNHLEIFHTVSGEKKGSLFWFLNKCLTNAGARLLYHSLNYPFKNKEDILQQLSYNEKFVQNPNLINSLEFILRNVADLEKLLARVAQNSIDPRGLAWIRQTLEQIPKFNSLLIEINLEIFSNKFLLFSDILMNLYKLLFNALCEEPSNILGKDGKIFKNGFNKEFDELIMLENNFSTLINELEKKEKENSGITTLKIGFSRSFGYYFEISKAKIAQVPNHFIRKQTLTNGERFTTEELKTLEEKILSASEKRIELEKELFDDIKQKILHYSEHLIKYNAFIAELDLTQNFAHLAINFTWCKPEISHDIKIELENSVHPILNYFATVDNIFIPNNIYLGELSVKKANILLITGPNMAGKSTIMRQVAISQILLQIGSYIPAQKACLSLCDRIFSRIGAGDNVLKNQSTFMVEMLECATILRQATATSLIIMDELGRGTSTFDGLSLAWSILEYLHDNIKACTLFSTHYHELINVALNRKSILPMQMEVIEQKTENNFAQIYFSRKFIEGSAGKSYGIHVAELAGIPENVIQRAEELLPILSKEYGKAHNVEKTELTTYIDKNINKKTCNKSVLPLNEDEKKLQNSLFGDWDNQIIN